MSVNNAQRIVDAMRHVAKEEDHQSASLAEVISVHGNFLKAKIKGSPGTHLIEKPSDQTLSIGDRALVIRPTPNDKWIFATRLGSGTGSDINKAAEDVVIQTPPNPTVTPILEGFYALWTAPPYKLLSYHCQVADDDEGTNAEDFYVSGSKFIYTGNIGDTKYFRVRAVSEAMLASPYSIWTSVELGVIDLASGPSITGWMVDYDALIPTGTSAFIPGVVIVNEALIVEGSLYIV